MCGTKVKYDTPASAYVRKSVIEKRDLYTVNIYKCPFCGSYHIGHKTNKPTPKLRCNKQKK